MRGTRIHRYFLVLLCVLCASVVESYSASPETNSNPARLKVRGYGFFGNRELKSLVSVLQTTAKKPEFFEANYVEDAVLVMFSRLRRDGYLVPTIRARVQFRDGSEDEFIWAEPLGEPLPRPFEAKRVEFEIEPGVLFYFEEIRFAGVEEVLPLRDAAHFFIETDALLKTRKNRRYSP